jgi:hypothetical protein
MPRFLLLFFASLFIFSCNNTPSHQQPFDPLADEILPPKPGQLLGEWRNLYTKVTMHTFKNTDSTRVLEVDEANWERMMSSKPIRTFFKADGTYNSEHRNLNDSMVYNPAGRWSLTGDSLFMTDTFPQRGVSYRYKILLKDNIVEFWGVEDFDQDGTKDDNYYGTQQKQ